MEKVKAGKEFTVYAKTLKGRTATTSDSESKIEESYFDLLQTDLKVKSKDDIKVKYWPNILENHRTVDHYGIRPDETIHSIHRCFGGKPPHPAFNSDELAPAFDYDFNSVEDDGRRYMRGGFHHKRPYGWKRIAIKVLAKYGDDTWLGRDGMRTEEAPGQWPVTVLSRNKYEGYPADFKRGL